MANPILVRQAIRKFKSDSITENDINELIRAFNASPCGLSQKVMSLTVIKSKEYLDMVEDKVGDAVYHAPLIFLISSQKDNQFGPLDSAAAAENVMVEAARLGLGSVYSMSGGMALNEYRDILQKLGVVDNYDAQVAVCLGTPEQELKELNRDGRYKVVMR